MTETAPIARPSRCTPLRAYAGEIHAAPSLVFAALERRIRTHSGEAGVAVDSSARFLVVQGGWWYRGEYRVVPDEDGSHLEHVILNIAQRGEKAALVAGRKVIAAAPLEFHDLVKSSRTFSHSERSSASSAAVGSNTLGHSGGNP